MKFTWVVAQESVLVSCSLMFLPIICIKIWVFCAFIRNYRLLSQSCEGFKVNIGNQLSILKAMKMAVLFGYYK